MDAVLNGTLPRCFRNHYRGLQRAGPRTFQGEGESLMTGADERQLD